MRAIAVARIEREISMVKVMRSNLSDAVTATSRPAPLVTWQTVTDESPSRLEVNLIFTTQQATLYALETVECLARDLRACIRLRAAVIVPYPLAADESPVSIPFLERSLFDLISRLERDGFEATAHLYFCRDREKTLLEVLEPNALVVIAGKKRWWPTETSRLAKAFRSEGHRVIFVDASRRNKRTPTEEKRDSLPVRSPRLVPSGNPGTRAGSTPRQ
jgi:hypothetical protein